MFKFKKKERLYTEDEVNKLVAKAAVNSFEEGRRIGIKQVQDIIERHGDRQKATHCVDNWRKSSHHTEALALKQAQVILDKKTESGEGLP